MSLSQRLVAKYKSEDASLETRVYRDWEWEEYVVRVYKNGIEQVLASYHTEHLDDAQDTAQAMVEK